MKAKKEMVEISGESTKFPKESYIPGIIEKCHVNSTVGSCCQSFFRMAECSTEAGVYHFGCLVEINEDCSKFTQLDVFLRKRYSVYNVYIYIYIYLHQVFKLQTKSVHVSLHK